MNATFEDSVLNMDEKDRDFGLNFAKHLRFKFYNDREDFLYDMVTALRYLNTNADTVAYTDREKYIYLNAPNGASIGRSIDRWKFIFIHECLHQIWDTFGVEDSIKKEQGHCDHELLNIASDCVINDFIYYAFRLDYPTDGLITPELLEEKFGVEYDSRKDNQASLYMKLLPKSEQIKKDRQIQDMLDEPTPNTNIPHNSQSGQGNSQGNQQSNQQGNQQGNSQGNQQGDSQGDSQSNSQGNQQGNSRNNSQRDQQNGYGKNSYSGGERGDIKEELHDFQEELQRHERTPQAILDRYKRAGAGLIGQFVSKCRMAKTEGDGIMAVNDSGRERKRWGSIFMTSAISKVRSGIASIEKEYRRTYARPNRRNGVVEPGQILKKGKIEIKRGTTITMKFFIDISTSMVGEGVNRVRNCFKSVYSICDAILKLTKNNRLIEKVDCLVYPFNDNVLKPVPLGTIPKATGGNCDFDELLDSMSEYNEHTMISVILTDAQWTVPVSGSVRMIRNLPGTVIVITNRPDDTDEIEAFKEIEQYCHNFKLIPADDEFTLSI